MDNYDFLRPSSVLSINLKFIKNFGIEAGVYLSLIMDAEWFSAVLSVVPDGDDKYLIIDRKRVDELIIMSEQRQLELDSCFEKHNIISRSLFNSSAIKINEKELLDFIGVPTDSKTKRKYNRKTKAEQRTDNAKFALEGTIKSIKSSDVELRNAYEEWLRTVFNSHGKTGKAFLEEAESQINEYAKGDTKLAIEVLKKAIAYSYLDVAYAIKKVEERKFNKLSTKNSTISNTKTNIYRKADVLIGEDFI